MSWRDRWRPASFRGVEFHIDTTSRASGRRGVTHEYPKRDTPSDEDLGLRARRWGVTGYLLGPDHDRDADRLEDALTKESPGLLVHPLMGEMRVRCDVYTRTERKQELRMSVFDMTFVESGTPPDKLVTDSTQQAVRQQADQAAEALGQEADKRLNI